MMTLEELIEQGGPIIRTKRPDFRCFSDCKSATALSDVLPNSAGTMNLLTKEQTNLNIERVTGLVSYALLNT